MVNYEGTRLAFLTEEGRQLQLEIAMKQESDFEYNSCSNGCQTNYSRGICLFGKFLLFVGVDRLFQLDLEESLAAASPVLRSFHLDRLETFHLDRSSETVYLATSADNSIGRLSLDGLGPPESSPPVHLQRVEFEAHLPAVSNSLLKISAIGGIGKHLYLATFEESAKSVTTRIWKVGSHSLEVRAQVQLPPSSKLR